MKYRWMVSEDGGSTFTKEVRPTVSQPLFEWKKETSGGRAGKRLVCATSLGFDATNGDYRYFKAIRDNNGACEPVYIRFEIKCGSTWNVLWTGRFPILGGSWDYRACKFVVSAGSLDKTTCVADSMAAKKNILKVGPVTANVVQLPSLEFLVCQWSGGAPICGVDDSTYYQARVWTPIPPFDLVVMWREYAITECVDDAPVAPPGSGWTLLQNDCATTGTAKYTRQPTIPWIFGDPQLFLDGDGFPIDPPESCGTWLTVGSYDFVIDPPGVVPFWICLNDADSTTLTRARRLSDVLEFLVDQLDCQLQGVRSDFLAINPVGDADGYVAGENYVKGGPTETDGIMIFHKTDVIDPGATQPATRGDMSLKELLDSLFTMYRLQWFVDEDDYLRIEHYKYFNSEVGLDLTTEPAKDVIEPMVHENLNDEVPNVERMAFDEALGVDFIGTDIVYSGACVQETQQLQEVEYNVKGITTDVSMILNDPTSVSRKGFVMIACRYNGSSWDAIIDTGALTGEFATNAPMSVANLQRDYWTWDRYLRSARMNNVDTDFQGSRPTLQQNDVSIMCFGCRALQFDPDGLVTTGLGQRHLDGEHAMIQSASLDSSGRLRLFLRYSK